MEPHFHNELRAFYNRRRHWTTQVRGGNMQPNNHGNNHHPNPNPNHQSQNVSPLSHGVNTQVFSDLETPSISNADNNPVALNPPTAQHHLAEHANLYSAIFSLNLGNTSASPTPVNSPPSSPTNTPLQPNNITDLNLVPEEATQDSFNEDTTPNFSLRRTWVDGIGPYIIIGN